MPQGIYRTTSSKIGNFYINRKGGVPDFVSKADVVFVNGINHTDQAALKKAAKIAYEAGKPVDLIYNPTEGPHKDIRESMIELTSGTEMKFTETLRLQKICAALNSEPPKPLVLIGHSQGSISTLNALRLYIEQDLKIPPEVVKQGKQAIIGFIKSKEAEPCRNGDSCFRSWDCWSSFRRGLEAGGSRRKRTPSTAEWRRASSRTRRRPGWSAVPKKPSGPGTRK